MGYFDLVLGRFVICYGCECSFFSDLALVF